MKRAAKNVIRSVQRPNPLSVGERSMAAAEVFDFIYNNLIQSGFSIGVSQNIANETQIAFSKSLNKYK